MDSALALAVAAFGSAGGNPVDPVAAASAAATLSSVLKSLPLGLPEAYFDGVVALLKYV